MDMTSNIVILFLKRANCNNQIDKFIKKDYQ